jgi:HlyD family secretion protein
MWARIRRWRWGGAIALLLALGIAYSFWPERVPVDIARVDRGEMAIGVTDDGVTRVRDLFTVSAPVSGYVTRIELDPGDRVVAGSTVIARMAPLPSPPLDTRTRAELESALRASQAGEAAAQAALTLARSDLERAEALAQRGFLSRARLEESRAARQSRAADLERARAESRRLQAAMSDPRDSAPRGGAVAVRSPESGVLLRRLTQSEGAIAMGTPLVEIGDPARIEVVLDLLSREAARVRTGNEVLITHWGGEETLRGRVSRVEPSGRLKVSALGIEEQRVDVIVGFDPVPAARLSALGHGYQVDGTVVLWRDRNALRVPVGALFRAPGGAWQVFVVEAGRARLRNVAIGRINEEYGQVLRGLKQGDEAILNPGSRIADGTRIARR